jgi:hypothetical protein
MPTAYSYLRFSSPKQASGRKNSEAGERVVTKKLPGWIRCDEGGRLELDPAGARAVRRIFAIARRGHSVLSIARTFNEEGFRSWGGR